MHVAAPATPGTHPHGPWTMPIKLNDGETRHVLVLRNRAGKARMLASHTKRFQATARQSKQTPALDPCDAVAMPILQVKAKPNARASSLSRQADGTWLAQLKSPPVDGKANAELIELIAREFGCTKSSVTIKTGTGGKLKRVVVPD